MTVLDSLIGSGRIVDVMLALVALEVLGLLLYRRLRGGGVAAVPLLANIGAGGSLMLALRASLVGGSVPLVAGWLIAALVFHVLDLALRWERAPAV
jgi:hypothetical protein